MPGTTTPYQFIPFSFSGVYLNNPINWFNPLMFDLGPIGSLGNVAHGFLRQPDLRDLDFSFNKDTKASFLGERGNIQFRLEVFNILNRANFGVPNATVFSGALTATTPMSQASSGATAANPLGNVGAITTTNTPTLDRCRLR